MIFEQKKIQSETLSEYLSQVRRDLNLSEKEVLEKTTIQPKFLAALENGNYIVLPADVYVFGFLKQLSNLYSIDATALIEQYKKERGIHQQISKDVKESETTWYKKPFKNFVITPKTLSLFLGTAFVIVSVAYIIWQVWSINRTPSLQLLSPANNSLVDGSSVKVVGQTDPGMNVDVNGQPIFVDNEGKFETQLGLNPGPAQIVVTAKNRFDKAFSQTLNIIGQATTTAVQVSHLQIKVDFTGPVTLGYSIDGQPEQSLSFNDGDSKSFSANQKILLSTSDAGATKVTVNGTNLGAMGRSKETLTDIPFFAQTDATTTP